MKNYLISIVAATLILSACGGGGGNSGPAPIPPPPVAGTPTAGITNSQATANDLSKTSVAAIASLRSASNSNNIPINQLVTNINNVLASGSVPVGTQSATVSCANANSRLDVTYTLSSSTGLRAGDSFMLSFTNCEFVPGFQFNGTIAFNFSRYLSTSDYAFSLSASNFTFINSGTTYGPFNYVGSIDVNNQTTITSYLINDVRVIGLPMVTDDGTYTTVASGVTHINYPGGGWIEVTYNNWVIDDATGKPVSGTMTLTAANGDTATISTDGVNYVVTITINGTTKIYNVAV